MRLSGLAKQILAQAVKEPGIKMKDLARKISKSPRSVEWPLRVLRELGLIRTKAGRKGGIYPTEDGRFLLETGEVILSQRVEIEIVAQDRMGLLAEISSNITKSGGSIVATTLGKPNPYIVEIHLSVEGVGKDRLKDALSKISGVEKLKIR